MASGSGWNLWVWLAGGGCGLVGVVVRRYIGFLIIILSLLLLYQKHPYFLFIILNVFRSFYSVCSMPWV